MIAREAENTKALRPTRRWWKPTSSTCAPTRNWALVPVNDQYYLTRVSFNKTLEDASFHPTARIPRAP